MTEHTLGNDNQNRAIIQWGREYLSTHGYTLTDKQPKEIQNTPWSYVVRFKSTAGYIYLKHTPKLLALEAHITQILHDQFHAPVPKVIASNVNLDCFLMKDAGSPLRTLLKKHFDATLLCKAIDHFTSLQLTVANEVNIFLDIGVPDWRLDKLPDLYMQLLSQKDVLITDGLSEKEIGELKALQSTVSSLCKKLSDYSIKQSIVQCDFHDNNILIDDKTQAITFIDLGEIVISHPFFSLVGCLRQMKKHYGLTEQDDAYIQLMDTCLKNYMTFEFKERLLEAFSLAHILWIIYEALAQYRLRLACDEARFLSFQKHGRLSGALKEFMTTITDTKG
ncbi:MAG: phosphotransferase [Coxiellaceae bacterium]|nr:phosphotransferase [Coxiellaceae bacterium]